MKKVVLFFAIAIAAVSANAQDKKGAEGFQFGAGVKVALPIGDFADGSSFALGGELQGEYMFSESFSALASAGYTNYFAKGGGSGTGLIPVLAGIRYYVVPEFFIGAKAGVGFSTESGGGSLFNYLPQVGYNASNFQLALGYDALTKNSNTSSAISLTGIYKFGGKK